MTNKIEDKNLTLIKHIMNGLKFLTDKTFKANQTIRCEMWDNELDLFVDGQVSESWMEYMKAYGWQYDKDAACFYIQSVGE